MYSSRRDDLAGLADLQLVGRDAGVDQRPRAAGGAAEHVGQPADEPLEVFAVLDCPAAGDDDFGLGDIGPGAFFDLMPSCTAREVEQRGVDSKRFDGMRRRQPVLAAG